MIFSYVRGAYILCLSAVICAFQIQPSFAFETIAPSAILMEAQTGNVLYEKNVDTPIPPASMSKLMTVYLVFEALDKGRITKDTEFTISQNARSQIGSRMFVEVGKKVKVIDLLRGAIVQSGNDACVALAEGLAGSVAEFVNMMNDAAQKIGLEQSSFRNPTGLPDDEHLMSVRDLAKLSRSLILNFPGYYKIYSETSFRWNNIKQGNRNPLLYGYDGADGVKTGYTDAAGYGLVGSARRGNMRLISVVSGLEKRKQRGTESRKLLNYGFGRFAMRVIGG
ncbi:MAG: D-alanyl-D-alanine carboxypeptidase family protein, partial [Pseudomonadota bacterium]